MPTLPQGYLLELITTLTAPATPAVAGAIWPCLAIGAAGLSGWLYLLLNRAQQEMAGTRERRAVLERLHDARDKHVATEMEAHKAALRENKQELGAQRKKTHAAQKALQAAQQALREEVKRREMVQNERPAFAETAPRIKAEPAPKAVVQAPVVAEETPEEPAPSAESLALQAELETLRRQHSALSEALALAKQAVQTQKQNAQRLQRRTEDLRRIDIISRSKVELLEDKLRGMGRQFYEAISELALLKGEVTPPKPKGLSEAPAAFNGEDMTPEMIDPTADAMHPTTLMAAEGEDEDEDNDGANAPTILDDLDSEGESDDGLSIPADFAAPQQPQA